MKVHLARYQGQAFLVRKYSGLANKLLLLALWVVACATIPAHARVIWVGDSSSCDVSSIQAAINIARASLDPSNEIRITKDHFPDGAWYGQALSIQNNSSPLTIGGNWDYCGQNPSTYQVGYQTISAFNLAQPVLKIRGLSRVSLYGMKIFLGAPGRNSNQGGGIDFQGSGSLTLQTMQIANNTGGLGGGIQVKGNIVLTLFDNVYVTENTALSGGGLYMAEGATLYMNAPYTFFHSNSASRGGAIYIKTPAIAKIGSPHPAGTAGVFYANSAMESGGAIFVDAPVGSASSVLDLYSLSGSEPLSFIGNSAGNTGAAISLLGNVAVCASNIYVADNQSNSPSIGVGATIAVGGGARYDVNTDDCLFRQPPTPVPACGPLDNTHCNVFSNNATKGGVIAAAYGGSSELNRVRLTGNSSTRALLDVSNGPASKLLIRDSVIDNNQAGENLIASRFGGEVTIRHVTATENTGSFSASLLVDHAQMLVVNSIFDQPQNVLSSGFDNNLTVDGLLARNQAGVPAGSNHFVGIPRYEPDFYRLRSDSFGVDLVYADPRLDADFNPRNVDNLDVPNAAGSGDVGAYESQATSVDRDDIFFDSFEGVALGIER